MFDLDSIIQKSKPATKPTPAKGAETIVFSFVTRRDNDEQIHKYTDTQIHDHVPPVKGQIVAELKGQMADVRKQRGKLSNYYQQLIADNASQAEFKKNYDKIEACTKEMQELYDKIVYVERNGHLPVVKQESNPLESNNLYALKDLRRSLNNRKSKLAAKLKNKIHFPEGSAKRQEMQLEYEKLEAEQDEVRIKIMRLEHEKDL